MSIIGRASILAVGSELLTSTRVDTNSLFITEALNGIGVEVVSKSVVGDNRHELAAQFAHALARVDLVIFTGGLGPTDDDITREVVAEHLGLPLDEDASILDSIRTRFAARGWKMPEVNRRQAMVPRGAVVLPNPNGTAPGLWIDHGAKGIALLPGPPREMKPMIERLIADRLTARTGGTQLLRRMLKIAGRTESRVEELTQPIYSRWRDQAQPIETTILAAPGQIELHLSTRGTDITAMNAALDAAVAQIVEVLGVDIFSHDDRRLEEVVGALLRERGWRIAIGESCTGGLVTSRLTDIAGSSDYVERAIVAYSNQAKMELLEVDEKLIVAHGAVSEPVAVAMAHGARKSAGAEVGVGLTGIAGPTGGTEQKPVGTVCIAVLIANRDSVGPGFPGLSERQRVEGSPGIHVKTFRFPGSREHVKTFASFTAIDMIRRTLLNAPSDIDWIKKT